jgi:Phage tail lysozyme
MADNVEEFILKYNVDVAETLRRLDSLNEKLDKTGKRAKQSVGGLGSEIKTVAKEFVAAGAAIAGAWAVIAKGIRLATDAMKDYNEQYLISRRTGIGTLGQENIALNMARASGGRIGRSESRSTLNAIGEVLNQAYTDPTRMNMQNVKLRMMGISPTGANGMVANAGDVMNQLSKRWSTMTQEMAEAEAELLGITPQAADAMRNLGGAVTDTSNMSLVAAKRQQEAAEAAKKLNESTTGITTDFQTMTKVLVDEAMPALAKFYKQIQDSTHSFATKLNEEGTSGFTAHAGRYFKGVMGNLMAGKGLPTTLEEQEKLWDQTKEQKSEAQMKAEADQVKQIADEQRKAADKQHEAAEKQQLTANQFAQAVSAMPGSLSMQQAIAAWAGEAAKGATVGGAGGIGGTSPAGVSPTSRQGKGVSLGGHGPIVDSLVAKGWTMDQAIGIAANLKQESNFDPNAVGDSGKAYGIGQWHADRQANFKKAFGKDIRGSSLEEQLAFVDWELRNSEKGAGNRLKGARSAEDAAGIVSQYYERPAATQVEIARRAGIASGMKPAGAFGLSEAQRWTTGSSIAAQIGMTPEQFMREGASRGDVQYGIDAQRKGMLQSYIKLENEIKGYQAAGKPLLASQKEGELYRMRQQMQGFENYSSGLLDAARPGGQERTQGMPPIQIIVNGTTDPHTVAQEVKRVLGQEMHKAVNDTATKHTG